MTKQDILPRYKDYRQEIKEYMDSLLSTIEENYGEIPQQFVISMDLLVFNLDILFDSVNDIRDKGLNKEDRYRGDKKNASVSAFFNAQNHINKILGSFGFNPLSSSKIKNNSDKVDVQKLIEDLAN